MQELWKLSNIEYAKSEWLKSDILFHSNTIREGGAHKPGLIDLLGIEILSKHFFFVVFDSFFNY